ncbi:MAG TPA: hypothetical protein VIJ12_11215 [Candidatus Baltobacteraceae bacterium]
MKPQSAIQGANWTQIPGSASFAAAAPDGSLWVLSDQPSGPDKYIWHYASGAWTNISGLASRIAVAPNGTLYAINSGGGTYSYSGGTWSGLGGGATGITIAADGSVYVLSNGNAAGNDQAIWHNVGGTWSQVPGSGVSIAGTLDTGTYAQSGGTVSPNGFYIINSQGIIYYENAGGTFVQLPANASALAPTTVGGVFALGYPANAAGNSIYYYDLNNPGWSSVAGAGVSISSAAGELYVISSSGGIYSTPVTTTAPAASVQTIPAEGNVVRGSGSASASSVMLAAISGAGDQTAAGLNGTFAVTSLGLGSGRSVQSLGGQPPMLRAPIAVQDRGPVEARSIDDHALRTMILRVPHGGTVDQAARWGPQASTIPTTLTVGSSTASIWVDVFAIGSSTGSFETVPATLEAQSTHGNIWIDSSLISGANSSSSFNAGNAQTTAGSIDADFENGYSSDTTHFGTPNYASNSPGRSVIYETCGATGTPIGSGAQYIAQPADQRINVMVLNSANLGAGVGGYFSSINYYPQNILNCITSQTLKSNEAPMIYVGWFQANGASYELNEDMVRGTAHESQHLINFVNHSILASGASSASYGGTEDTFINEGLSMLAQDLAVNTMFPSIPFDSLDALNHAAAYLNAPQNFSISGFIGIDSSPYGNGSTVSYNCGGGCYGGAYLFERYMRDRFGGDTYTHSMETNGALGFANLVASCQCSETAPQLLQDFALAMAANTVGVTGESAQYSFGTLNLDGGSYPSQLPIYRTPDLTGLNARVLQANNTASGPAPLGGFAFFHSTAGQAFSITDTNPTAGFGLAGGLAQH